MMRASTVGRVGAGAGAVLLAFCAACGRSARPADTTVVKQAGASERSAGPFDPARYQPPSLASLPNDSLGTSIRRGRALFLDTKDSLPAYVGGNLSCRSCHLDEGARRTAAPLLGVYARFPKYLDRSGVVVPLEDRVNYCFTRSLNGSRIPSDSRQMQDIVAYLAFISAGVPVGTHFPVEGLIRMPALAGDSARGAQLFAARCARCHGTDGQGVAIAPALWGGNSYSIGASMARVERAASFIRHNMPFDSAGTLSDQQAYDLAAFVNSHPRPDSPGKEHDWPNGGAPPDVPYDTKGHRASRPPRLIARMNSAAALVPPPARIAR